MKRHLLTAALIVVALPALAQTQTQTTPSTSTRSSSQTANAPAANQSISTPQFVRRAAISDMYEIQAAQTALQKSNNQDVKSFAQQMIDGHQKTTNELKGLVQSANIQGVTMPTRLDFRHRRMINQLHRASGQQFDRVYERQQIQAHQDAVNLFQSYARNGDNQQLKQWAQNTLPILQSHLQQAHGLEDKTVGRR